MRSTIAQTTTPVSVLWWLYSTCAVFWSMSATGTEKPQNLGEKDRYNSAIVIYGNPTLRVPEVTESIRVDCSANEEAWTKAAVTSVDWLASPVRNIPATEETTVRVFQNGLNLYVFFDARDSNPEAVRAHFRRRDKLFSDDYVGLGIDTAGDGTRIFEFFGDFLLSMDTENCVVHWLLDERRDHRGS